MRKNHLFLCLFLSTLSHFAQDYIPYTYGVITQDDVDLKVYEKDSTANAIFLFEYGKTKFFQTDYNIVIRTKYYGKVKIFNKEGEEHATIRIPIYKNNNAREKVQNIRAITHNGSIKTSLNQKDIFTEKINDNWSEVKFTMPNIKDNSIIEYEYTLESPFKFNFKGWEFQSNIPKLYSEFYALIPGNYVYNRRLRGYQELHTNKSNIKKRCFSVDGVAGIADCEELIYAMKDIPAFVEEDYLTSKKNFLSAIKFEMSQYNGYDGSQKKFTKTWKYADKEFKTEKSIGKQLRKTDYLKKQLPTELLTGENDLAKAKKIYYHIVNHFTWNGEYKLNRDVNIKTAYAKKTANSTEINISLINALNAAGFDAKIVLISTRNNGLPTKAYPVLTDFNYAIAKLSIGDTNYLLDATSKNLPFNMLPFRTLNSYGRVMDFKKGSYWHPIEAKKNNRVRTALKLTMDANGDFKGQMQKAYDGYRAINKRIDIRKTDEDEYITKAEEAYGVDDNLIINSYSNSNLIDIEKPLKELYDVTIESNLDSDLIIINPFINGRTSVNPFKLNQRTYPIDFGYASSSSFNLQLTIPDNYTIKSLPKNQGVKLPNDGGIFTFSITEKDNKIQMIFRRVIKRSFYAPQEYPFLKEFFKQIIKTQKSLITLEKI